METFLDIVFEEKIVRECFEKVYIQQWVCIDIMGETPTHHVVPYIQDLSILAAHEVKKTEKETLIAEAIKRSDHELFNLSENSFRDQVLSDIINYPEWDRKTTLRMVDDIILKLIFTHDIFVKDYHHQLRFLPVKGVW